MFGDLESLLVILQLWGAYPIAQIDPVSLGTRVNRAEDSELNGSFLFPFFSWEPFHP